MHLQMAAGPERGGLQWPVPLRAPQSTLCRGHWAVGGAGEEMALGGEVPVQGHGWSDPLRPGVPVPRAEQLLTTGSAWLAVAADSLTSHQDSRPRSGPPAAPG